jgi:hypothetical protein
VRLFGVRHRRDNFGDDRPPYVLEWALVIKWQDTKDASSELGDS